MVTVDKYIRKLLFEHDCVIIPEFGGLLIHQVGAYYDTAQALFLPSVKRVAFNEVLKLDDGLLTYYISVHERIPREEAVAIVKKFVDTLRATLKEGRIVTLESIGSFTANSEGKPVFEPEPSQNYNNNWYGLEALTVHPLAATTQDMVVEDSELPVLSEIVEDTEITSDTTVKWQSNWFRWAAAAVVTGAVFTMSLIYKPVDNSLLSTLNPLYSISELYVSTIAPLYRNDSDKEKVNGTSNVQKNEHIVSEFPIQSDSLAKNQVSPAGFSEETSILNTVTELNVDQHVDSKNYYLIAGSFGELKNASLLKDMLIQKGFHQAEILDAPAGRLIKVAVGSYPSMSDAIVDKKKVDQLTKAESWVYQKK